MHEKIDDETVEDRDRFLDEEERRRGLTVEVSGERDESRDGRLQTGPESQSPLNVLDNTTGTQSGQITA